MPTDRRNLYNALPDRIKTVNQALNELNEVVTGGAFQHEKIWGENGETDIAAYMTSLNPYGALHAEVKKLLDGLPTSSAVKAAVDAMITGLQEQIANLQTATDELKLASRMEAFNRLNDPHSTAEGYTYQPTDHKYGFIPALEGVINAAAGTQADLDKVMGPIKDVVAVAAAGDAMVDFMAYAAGTLQLLTEVFDLNANYA